MHHCGLYIIMCLSILIICLLIRQWGKPNMENSFAFICSLIIYSAMLRELIDWFLTRLTIAEGGKNQLRR